MLSIFAAFLFSSKLARSAELKGSRPNIILIMTDDQGMGDLSCLGNPVLQTPHLDEFYSKSTHFTEFHVSPTCAPTRSAIFSGRHEFRNGVTHTIKERERMALSTVTFVDLLSENGYETGIFGKWHLGDEDEYQPYNRGFTKTFIHGAGGIGQSFPGSCADFPPNRTNRYFDCCILNDDTIVQTSGFCTDVFFQAALQWTKEKLDSNQPFFTYLTLNAPHGPMIAPDSYKQRFLDLGYDGNTAGRYGMLENIDDNMGLLVRKLDEWKAWENTLVIFMTDNGQAGRTAKLNGKKITLHTAGFKTGKGSPYEGGTHVPAFWRWKGVLGEGVDINELSAHIDLFDTFCDLAGVDIPDNVQPRDGRSMLPLLEDATTDLPDRRLFTHVGRWKNGQAASSKLCAVRTQRWRFVNNKELYDIENDPFEKSNVIDQFPEVVSELRAAYDQWWEATLPLMINEGVEPAPEQPQAVRYAKQLESKGIPTWPTPNL
ncbi:MAG: arylsulfatase [Aureliella sp.]